MVEHVGDDGGLGRIRRRDEVLQVLFWMEGEGFEEDMTAAGVKRFVARPESDVRAVLDELVSSGLAVRAAAGSDTRYALTAEGKREGGRRFIDEFGPLLARDVHGGECHEPDCECHTSAEGAAVCRAERERAG